MPAEGPFDVAVVGAGAFGAWTAYHLAKAGRRVALLDAYGPGSSRATSGDETRIIRLSYGPNELYTRWTQASLGQWKALAAEAGQTLFAKTGVLRLAAAEDRYAAESATLLTRLGAPFERLDRGALARRFPQIGLEGLAFGLLEPESGTLMARRGVTAAAQRSAALGATVRTEAALAPEGRGSLAEVQTRSRTPFAARRFVFACGPWLPKLFPFLSGLIDVPRAECLFFGPPPGSRAFAPPQMPAWIDNGDDNYGVPDIEERGFKLGIDPPPTPFDPDTGDRTVGADSVARARVYLKKRFPALAEAPLVEARVCQYEDTPSGDFLVDRHPDFDNVWLAGGGSGHGFKLGPAVGEYVAGLVLADEKGSREPADAAIAARFALATHRKAPPKAIK